MKNSLHFNLHKLPLFTSIEFVELYRTYDHYKSDWSNIEFKEKRIINIYE